MAIVQRPRDRALLVTEAIDPGRRTFHRPPGGSIEVGEAATETVVREFAEEFGLGLVGPTLLGAMENRFTHDGRAGHEIVLVVRADLADPTAYELGEMEHLDAVGVRAVWRSHEASEPRLVPDGIGEFIDRGLEGAL